MDQNNNLEISEEDLGKVIRNPERNQGHEYTSEPEWIRLGLEPKPFKVEPLEFSKQKPKPKIDKTAEPNPVEPEPVESDQYVDPTDISPDSYALFVRNALIEVSDDVTMIESRIEEIVFGNDPNYAGIDINEICLLKRIKLKAGIVAVM